MVTRSRSTVVEATIRRSKIEVEQATNAAEPGNAGLMKTTTGAAVETPAVVLPPMNGPPLQSQSQPNIASVSNMTPPPSIFRLYRATLHLPPLNRANPPQAKVGPSPTGLRPNIIFTT